MESLAYTVSIVLLALLALGVISLVLALRSKKLSRTVAWTALSFAAADLVITAMVLRNLRPTVFLLFSTPGLLALVIALRSLRQHSRARMPNPAADR
jgi:hypothetical protein